MQPIRLSNFQNIILQSINRIAICGCLLCGGSAVAAEEPVLSFSDGATKFFLHKLWSKSVSNNFKTEPQSMVVKDNIIYIPDNPQSDADNFNFVLRRFDSLTGDELDPMTLVLEDQSQAYNLCLDMYPDFYITTDDNGDIIAFFPQEKTKTFSYTITNKVDTKTAFVILAAKFSSMARHHHC